MANAESGRHLTGTPVLNVALLGDSGVGKTSLIRRFKYNTYIENVSCDTLGDFEDVAYDVPIHDNREQRMIIRLHDTAGMEANASSITSSFYSYIPMLPVRRHKEGIIYAWDITREETYRRMDTWELQVNNHYHDNKLPAYIIVANKAENEGMESKTYQQCLDDYQRKKVSCFKTSAMTALNVKAAFDELITQMGRAYRDRINGNTEESDKSVNLTNSEIPDHPGRGDCCNK